LKRWLQRHPLFAAEWLQVENRVRRLAEAPLRMLALAALIGAGLLILLGLSQRTARPDAWLTSLQLYWPIVLSLAAIYAAMLTGRRRGRAEAQQDRSWLGAAPISSTALTVHRVAHALAPLFLHVLALSVLVLLAAQETLDSALRVVGLFWGGAILGAAVGWFTRLGRPHERREDSRYAPRGRGAPTLDASLASLSRWPIAQTFAWGRPENLRALVVVCLLLGVQAGASALHGLLIIAVWLAGGYVSSLLFAVPRAAQAAALWLRTTPLAFGRFAWALARRALLHQAVGVVLLGAGLIAIGAALCLALYLAALWLSIVVLVYAIGAADAYQGRSPTMKLALSFAGIAAVESRFHAWSVPAALLFAAWRLRSARR
jgi:hypothetical protein